MPLTLLGKSYQSSSPSVEASRTGETSSFLGKSYARKQFNIVQRHQRWYDPQNNLCGVETYP